MPEDAALRRTRALGSNEVACRTRALASGGRESIAAEVNGNGGVGGAKDSAADSDGSEGDQQNPPEHFAVLASCVPCSRRGPSVRNDASFNLPIFFSLLDFVFRVLAHLKEQTVNLFVIKTL